VTEKHGHGSRWYQKPKTTALAKASSKFPDQTRELTFEILRRFTVISKRTRKQITFAHVTTISAPGIVMNNSAVFSNAQQQDKVLFRVKEIER
jgi:alcohol dehydrogenase YqhD (iron-dependent ADH family)